MCNETEKNVEGRKQNARTSHKMFEKAFIDAGCPPGFRYSYDHKLKVGKQIMTPEFRKNKLAEEELPDLMRKLIIRSRIEEYLVKKQREKIKDGL